MDAASFLEDEPWAVDLQARCLQEGVELSPAELDQCRRYEVDLWPGEACDVDVVSQETIPPDRRLRLRVVLPDREGRRRTKLVCYDALTLKQLLYVAEQERKPAKLPDSNIVLTKAQLEHIKKHPVQLPAEFLKAYAAESKRRASEYLAEIRQIEDVQQPVRRPPGFGAREFKERRPRPYAAVERKLPERASAWADYLRARVREGNPYGGPNLRELHDRFLQQYPQAQQPLGPVEQREPRQWRMRKPPPDQ